MSWLSDLIARITKEVIYPRKDMAGLAFRAVPGKVSKFMFAIVAALNTQQGHDSAALKYVILEGDEIPRVQFESF